VVSTAIYLASTDVPVVQARKSEEAKAGVKAEKPVNVKLKNRPAALLTVPLKLASQYEEGSRLYQTHSCHVPPDACVPSGWAKQVVQLLPTLHPDEYVILVVSASSTETCRASNRVPVKNKSSATWTVRGK